MKDVQIRLDENLLRAIDRLAAAYKLSRSALVREAFKKWIRQRIIQELEKAWTRKLKENPDDITDSDKWLNAEQ